VSDTAARLLRLLSFLQTPREWSGSELAERLEVSPRTVRRDVDRLRELGYPVQATLGMHGGYRLAAGKAMPPLLVDDEEAVAIVIGLRTAARQPVAGIAEASLRALAKLQQVLPPRLSRRVGALSAATASATLMPSTSIPTASTSTAPVPTTSTSTSTPSTSTPSTSTPSTSTLSSSVVEPEQLILLAAAAMANERIRFDYRSDSATISQRLVEPQSLVVVDRRWYLLAYDNERQDWRTFRVDRIEGAKSTGVRVPPRQPPSGDASRYVTDQLLDLASVFQAVATLALPAERAAARLGDWAGELTPIDDKSCLWRSPEETVDWLAFRLALLGCDFTVHEPAELSEHLRRLGKRINRAVARPPAKTAKTAARGTRLTS